MYLVQPNNSLSGSLFLPYAAGAISAYCFSDEEIRSRYRLAPFIFIKEDVQEVLKKTEDPAVMGFSCYMWNVEYNLSLAREVKKKYPECTVVFGGPQVPDDTGFLKEYGFIDILIHGEGEKAFSDILRQLPPEEINNISYRKDGGCVKNERKTSGRTMDYPSPYTMGLFDYIVDDPDNSHIQFDAILETNRGCPYGCIYCCWAGSGESFRYFPLEKVKAELRWMAEKKIAYCICADSNFGIAARDEEIADYIAELKKEYGYPEKFETTAAKDKDELTFRINSKFEQAGLNRGISVAVQSMSPSVLKTVGRKNVSFENLSGQLRKYRENNMYTYTDIILGLPGETQESFCRGLFQVIEAGQHYSINVNRCELLPNTVMYSKEMIEKYRIKTVRSFLCQNHSTVVTDNRYGSRSELVVETDTMSRAQWRECLRISVCAQSFHCMGLLRYPAVYLRKIHNISYYDFYMNFYRRISENDGFILKSLNYVCASVDTFLSGKGSLGFSDDRFGNIYWSFEEGLFLVCACDADAFYREAAAVAGELLGEADERFTDLMKYQQFAVSLPARQKETETFGYDWQEFFGDIFKENVSAPLKETVVLEKEESAVDNWTDYARQVVWYGKRNDRMILKKDRIRKLS